MCLLPSNPLSFCSKLSCALLYFVVNVTNNETEYGRIPDKWEKITLGGIVVFSELSGMRVVKKKLHCTSSRTFKCECRGHYKKMSFNFQNNVTFSVKPRTLSNFRLKSANTRTLYTQTFTCSYRQQH